MNIKSLINDVRNDKLITNIEDRIKLLYYYRSHLDQFITDNIKIPQIGGNIPFNPYQKQKEIIKSFVDDHYILVLKSRQIGLSTIFRAIILSVSLLWPNVTCGVISKDGPEATNFVKKTLDMADELPLWIKPLSYKKKTEQQFILNNNSKIIASAVNAHKPENVLRGESLAILIIDEAAFIDYVEIAYSGMAPAVSQVHNVAKNKNIPYGTIIISTPNKTVGIGQWYYSQYVTVKTGNSKFKLFEIHWSQIEGLGEEWYNEQCDIIKNKNLIAQELDMKFIATGNCVIKEQDVQEYLQDKDNFPEPDVVDIKVSKILGDHDIDKLDGDFKFQQWSKPKDGYKYLIGVDIATLRGACNTSIIVFESLTMEQVGLLAASVSVLLLPEVIKRVMDIYENNVTIIERNSIGETVLEELHATHKYRDRLYQTKKELKNGRVEYLPGFLTTSLTRPLAMSSLLEFVDEYYTRIKSYAFALELIGLVDRSGRIVHGKGSLDDIVMSATFCTYVRSFESQIGLGNKLSVNQKKSLNQFFGTNLDENAQPENNGEIDWTNLFL